MAKVIFNVGEKHTLYNKVVEAEIITRNGGYNKRTIEAITKEEVHFPSDPKGIFVMDEYGDIIGYKEREAYTKKWQGWVKEIVEDDVPQYFTTHIYDFNSGAKIAEMNESEPFRKGEEFEPIEGFIFKVICVSEINNGVQIVFAHNITLE